MPDDTFQIRHQCPVDERETGTRLPPLREILQGATGVLVTGALPEELIATYAVLDSEHTQLKTAEDCLAAQYKKLCLGG